MFDVFATMMACSASDAEVKGLNDAASAASATLDYPISPGNKRILVVGITNETNSPPLAIPTVTYGGRTLTHVVGNNLAGGGQDNRVDLFILFDTDIRLATDTTITTSDAFGVIHARSYANAQQSVPTITAIDSGTTSAGAFTSLSAARKSATVALATANSSASTATWGGTNPCTELTDQGSGNNAGSMSNRFSTNDETVNCEATWTGSSVRFVTVAMQIKKA